MNSICQEILDILFCKFREINDCRLTQLCFRLQGGSDRLVDTLDVVTINKRNVEVKKEYYFALNNIATLNEICNVATAVCIFVLTISIGKYIDGKIQAI